MTRTRLTFNGRDEWLEARKDGIGASEVGTIVGLNPWETPYQLWRRKIGLDAPKPMTKAMIRGHILEDGVARYFAEETGREIIKSSVEDFMFIDKEKPFLRVSPDRTYWLDGMPKNDDNKGILECKTADRMEVDVENIPMYWFCQVQMNLGIAEYTHGSLAWLSGGQGLDFGHVDMQLVPDYFGWLKEEVERFWVDNIKGGQEPELSNINDVLVKHAKHTNAKIIEANADIIKMYDELKVVREDIKALEAKETKMEDAIKIAMLDAEALMRNGKVLVTWKAPKASMKFDSKRFIAENPELAKRYMVPTQGARRFLIK